MVSRQGLVWRLALVLAVAGSLGASLVQADDGNDRSACRGLPSQSDLKTALSAVVTAGGNGGLAHDMWATVVNRDGQVCAVAFTGDDRGAQWPGSRVISAQKANTANAFSLPAGSTGVFPGLALSTANLYSAVQPGGTLFGLQESNPVDTSVAYGGNAKNYGQHNDPMVGKKIGGVNVFGGGLGLYAANGEIVGGVGVSGDTSCTDHIVAWKVRDALLLDNVPAGVSPNGDDNIIFDTTKDPVTGHTVSAGGFGHPECDATATAEANNLPVEHPVGP
jgi:uncharacterized protein GlcG (DUF336 family)